MKHQLKQQNMKTLKFLILILSIGIASCGEDDEQVNEVCKFATITYGQVTTGQVYDVLYEGDKIIAMTSEEESAEFTYDDTGNLAKREFFSAGDSHVQFRTEFTFNTLGDVTETRNWRLMDGELEYTGNETYGYNGAELIEIKRFREDGTNYQTLQLVWVDGNPISINTIGQSGLEYYFDVMYDSSKENEFNAAFRNFMFYDFYDNDFNIYQSLSKNTVMSASFYLDDGILQYTEEYNYTLLPNGLTDRITFNGDLLWKFEYGCN